MKTVFVIVDMQNDFLTGALGAPDCYAVVHPIVEMIHNNVKPEDLVFFTRDTHEEATYSSSKEGSQIPPHCYRNTQGWQLEENIQSLHDELAKKNPAQVNYIDKRTFGSEELFGYLNQHEKEIDRIVLCGVCTSICVISNAVLARAACPNSNVTVVSSCCGDGNPKASQASLTAMESLQIDVVKTL